MKRESKFAHEINVGDVISNNMETLNKTKVLSKHTENGDNIIVINNDIKLGKYSSVTIITY